MQRGNIIDGNMKNRWDVCMAKNVGCIEYPGLPGHIKSGCTSTLRYKSRYCQEHEIHACNRPSGKDDDNDVGDQIVEMIVEKKTTRSNTFFKVSCEVNNISGFVITEQKLRVCSGISEQRTLW